MSSYFARIGEDRLVAVTGATQGGLIRIVDVDVRGNPVGSATYVPANVALIELIQDSNGNLVEGTQDNQQIDWEAHADTYEYNEETGDMEPMGKMPSVSPTNPAMAAFPELASEE